ncbi:hypothetical protein AB0C24_11795 [Amycolatopsis japonica]|uniref:hypothetical protein n=1 Tax=Amycolatopsis japonica TaxID=208439 RepID=UPI0033CB2EC6
MSATIITNIADAKDPVKLASMALAAALPPFISMVGPWRHIRVSMAALVSIGALFLTYGGSLAAGAAANVEFVPSPRSIIAGPATTPSPSPPLSTTPPGMDVAPVSLSCKPKCDRNVTIANTGIKTLQVTAIDLEGPGKDRFSRTGTCAHKMLKPGQACSVSVLFTARGPQGEQTAQLVINNNRGSAAIVTLTGEATSPGFDLTVSVTGLKCVYQPAGAPKGRDVIEVSLRLSMTGTKPSNRLTVVPVAVRGSSGASTVVRGTIGSKPGSIVAVLPIRAADYNQRRTITVTVDPGNTIAEQKESNNQSRAVAAISDKPVSSVKTALDCTVR